KKQTKQRSKFTLSQNFLRSIVPVVRIGFKDFAVGGMSAFNAAMSYNMINGFKSGANGNELDYANVLVSRGSLSVSNSINAHMTGNELLFSWDSAIEENAKSNDQVMVIAYNSTKEVSVYDINAVKRKSANASISLPTDWSGDVIETYIAFKNEEGTMVSNSCYTGSFTV
ncbi:MAG TPA: DUF6266 family protein, partial [Fermentimonas sp.]|nr:DUF6266 family protein [Fermentimonas sp.]